VDASRPSAFGAQRRSDGAEPRPSAAQARPSRRSPRRFSADGVCSDIANNGPSPSMLLENAQASAHPLATDSPTSGVRARLGPDQGLARGGVVTPRSPRYARTICRPGSRARIYATHPNRLCGPGSRRIIQRSLGSRLRRINRIRESPRGGRAREVTPTPLRSAQLRHLRRDARRSRHAG
jgi:hypothetical protein